MRSSWAQSFSDSDIACTVATERRDCGMPVRALERRRRGERCHERRGVFEPLRRSTICLIPLARLPTLQNLMPIFFVRAVVGTC